MISFTELFISNAHAEGAAAPQEGGIMAFLPLIALLAVFYFLILRPQQKRTKEHKAMMDALQKGDEIVTNGGALGRVEKVGAEYVAVEVAQGIIVQYQKFAIQTVLPKGTIKAL